jgi:TolB-like protein
VASAETPQPKSLVVLPFRYIGAEPDGEYFADGLTAEIITDLSKLHALRVTSWTSARRYRDSTLSARDLARELDVHYVIEGTIQRAGRDLRATAHLVDATNDAELWSEKYAGTLDDVFDIQERVSVGVSRGLKVALGRGAIPAAARSIANPQAYDLYLRARGEIWSFTATGPRRAIVRIDQALALVGPNALLLATRAAALWQIVNTGAGALSNLAEAALTARGALELDPESAPANRVLALISAMQGESTAADQLIGRALAASPADPETLSSACFFYTLFGDGDRAVALGRRATELDPLYALHWSALAFALASIGRDDDAADAVYRAFEVDPSDLPTQVIAPLILYGRGDPSAMMDRLPLAAPPDRATAGGYAGLAFLTRLALVGDRARVLALLTPDVQAFLASGIHNALYAAEVCSLVGEAGRALWFLQKSADLGLGCYPLLAKHSRSLAPLRSELEFARILGQVEASWKSRHSA